MTLPLPDLAALVRGADPADLPGIVGKLAEAQAAALARLTTPQANGQEEEDRLLTLPEVAKILGVPEDRAYDLARQRRFPVVVIGKYRRVRESALRAYVAANEEGARPVSRARRSA